MNGLYQVSNMGKIKSLKRNIVMKQFKDNLGYLCINLQTKQHKKKKYRIHRIVAKTFLLNFSNLPQVNHIDGNKLNNHIDNLEWCTASENMQHAWGNGLCHPYWKNKFGINNKNSKPVYQINIYNNKIIKKYNSIKEAKKELNINNSNISKCCKGSRFTCAGYKWRYVNEDNN